MFLLRAAEIIEEPWCLMSVGGHCGGRWAATSSFTRMPNDFDRLLAMSLFRYRRSRAALRASKLLLNVSRIGIGRGRGLLGTTGEPKQKASVRERARPPM